jgi:pyruvate dehydrogenase E1 component beta subunit
VTLIAFSKAVGTALAAAEELAGHGIDAEVLDLRTLAPLDTDGILESVGRTGRAVVVHEAVVTGGIGAEIAARIQQHAFGRLEAPVLRVGAPFAPVPSSIVLEQAFVPDAAAVVDAARMVLGDLYSTAGGN